MNNKRELQPEVDKHFNFYFYARWPHGPCGAMGVTNNANTHIYIPYHSASVLQCAAIKFNKSHKLTSCRTNVREL